MDWFDSQGPYEIADQMGVNIEDVSGSKLPKDLTVYFYRATGGEIESRVVEASHKLTQEELKKMPLVDRIKAQKIQTRKEAGKELEIFEDYAFPTKGEDVADIFQTDSIIPNFNFPSTDIKVIKNFIKKSFKKIPELKHLSKIKKGDTIDYNGFKYVFEEFINGNWSASKDFTLYSNIILNPIKNSDSVGGFYTAGPMARLRLKSSSDKSLKSIETFQESIKVPVLYLKDGSFSVKSKSTLRNEILKLNKPKGLMSRIFKKD